MWSTGFFFVILFLRMHTQERDVLHGPPEACTVKQSCHFLCTNNTTLIKYNGNLLLFQLNDELNNLLGLLKKKRQNKCLSLFF